MSLLGWAGLDRRNATSSCLISQGSGQFRGGAKGGWGVQGLALGMEWSRPDPVGLYSDHGADLQPSSRCVFVDGNALTGRNSLRKISRFTIRLGRLTAELQAAKRVYGSSLPRQNRVCRITALVVSHLWLPIRRYLEVAVDCDRKILLKAEFHGSCVPSRETTRTEAHGGYPKLTKVNLTQSPSQLCSLLGKCYIADEMRHLV